MDRWEHMQKVDYEQLPFKCKKFHEYCHFIKKCPKVVQETSKKNQEEGWKQTKRGRKTPPISTEVHPKISKENPKE